MKISVDEYVDASPDEVFAVALDIPHWAERIGAIKSIDMLTGGPVAPGTRFRETRVMFGREAAEEMTVADIDAPRRFILTAENHGTRYRATHAFAAEGRGTRMRLDFEGVPVTWTARLMMPLGFLMIGTLRKQLAADLADLKRAAEGRS